MFFERLFDRVIKYSIVFSFAFIIIGALNDFNFGTIIRRILEGWWIVLGCAFVCAIPPTFEESFKLLGTKSKKTRSDKKRYERNQKYIELLETEQPETINIESISKEEDEVLLDELDKHKNNKEKINQIAAATLLQASETGYLNVVKKCLAEDIDIDTKADDGTTPLINAAMFGRTEIVELLLAHGADANTKANDGTTALMLAARNGHFYTVERLLEKGVDVNAAANGGETALMFAAQRKNADIVRLLIENGADVNAKTHKGTTVLKAASVKNNQTVCKMLKKLGATY